VIVETTAAGAADSEELTNSILQVQDRTPNKSDVIFGSINRLVKQ
jgi:hypothetical protein